MRYVFVNLYVSPPLFLSELVTRLPQSDDMVLCNGVLAEQDVPIVAKLHLQGFVVDVSVFEFGRVCVCVCLLGRCDSFYCVVMSGRCSVAILMRILT